MNAIQNLIQTDIDCLVKSSNGFNTIQHNATKGTLREKLLVDFFSKLIPNQLSIASGIICDASGTNSNQTDFIVYNKSILPSILLSNDISIIPVETVYLIAEIKTTLRTNDLKQVENARQAFNKLQFSNIKSNKQIKIPSVILAFENEISEETLQQWMNNQNDVVSICIINKFTLSKENNGIVKYNNDTKLPKYWETLNFSILLYNFLRNELNQKRDAPLWGAYLQGVEEFLKNNRHIKR